MTEANYEDIADVSREEDVVRGVLLGVALVCGARPMPRRVPILFVRAVPKLRMHGREHLRRRRRGTRVRQAVREVLPFVQNCVLRARGRRRGHGEGRCRRRRGSGRTARPCACIGCRYRVEVGRRG